MVPTVAMKYDRDQSVGRRERRRGNSSRRMRDDTALNLPTTSAGAHRGSVSTKRWTWSGLTSKAWTVISRRAATSRISSFSRASTGFVSTGRRYFGHQTTWYLRLNTAPAFLAYRAPALPMLHYITVAHITSIERAHSP